jgi:hypothetical protein
VKVRKACRQVEEEAALQARNQERMPSPLRSERKSQNLRHVNDGLRRRIETVMARDDFQRNKLFETGVFGIS